MLTSDVLGQLSESVAGITTESTQQAVGYPTLFLLVALGALVPVVPTGAVVSSAAVVAFHQTAPLSLLFVFLVASSAAFAGDVTLYWLGLRGVRSKNGSRRLRELREHASPERLEQAREKLADHGVTVLVLSRLIPAGRIPVMLACLLSGMRMRTFIRGNLPACLAWAVTYQLIGILGGSLFDEAWKGVMVAVVLTVVLSSAPALWRRLRRPRRHPEAPGEA
ncbi:VTT domain-containing protein [Streptomyces sp. CAU 1734]|uniref:DedA family protein n=1 Tax=Streptomyces sp. CAU 1734 TaxID=3140360 RepID=UPI0032604983